jgi:hypothetical protein
MNMGNQPSRSMKVDWFLEQVRNYKLLKKNSTLKVIYNDTGFDLSSSTSEIYTNLRDQDL